MDQENNRHSIINILQWNAQSLRPKATEFEALLSQEKVHIAIISETWFEPESNFRISGYNTFRDDRDDGYGGVAILTHWSLRASRCNTNTSNAGIQLLQVRVTNCEHLENVIAIYCPSSVYTSKRDWDQIFSLKQERTLITGDFNGHHTNWSSKTDARGLQLFDSIFENNYVALNDGTSTRVKLVNGILQSTSPDLTIASLDLAMKFSWQVMNENLGSDHLVLKIKTEINTINTCKTKRNYKRAEWVKYREIIKEKVHVLDIQTDNQKAYDNFIEVLNTAADQSIPKIKICDNPIRQQMFKPKPYWGQDLSRAVAERRLALAEFRKNPTPQNLDKIQRKTSEAQKLIRNSKLSSFRNFCDSLDNTMSAAEVYRRMKWLKGHRMARCAVDQEQSEKLLHSLAPDYVSPPPPNFISENEQLSSPISIQELNNCIKQTDTAPGGDDISYSMIRHLPEEGKLVLVSLYNRFLLSGFAPKQWREVKIVPIPKPGRDAGSVSGIRPIALLSCPCKILHTILNRRLEWFLERNNCFADETTGFRRMRSCADNLTRLVSRIQEGFSKNSSTLVCFIDIDSAYNNINLVALLNILDRMGVGAQLCRYLWEFLHDRHLSIQINDSSTVIRTTGTGIAQGDPLSPLLFNAATSKICHNIVEVSVSQYADDFVLYVTKKQISDSVTNIQNSLKIFQCLIEEVGLEISLNKTKICLFSKGRTRNVFSVKINNHSIQQVDNAKYLGMWLDKSLKWKKHINELREKCSRLINIFKVLAGSKWGVHPKHLRRLYISMIRSRFDYCSFLFGNYAKSQLNKLDGIQNLCMRIIGGFIRSTPIHVMENELCLQPLQIRRRYLAGKFWLKSRSIQNNVTISIIDELSNLCEGQYWRNKKIPLIVDMHRKLQDLPIYSSPILGAFSLNTWLSSIDLTKNIYFDIPDVHFPKRSMNTLDLMQKCSKFLCDKYGTFYQLYTDGSKDAQCAGAAVFDPQSNDMFKFKIKANISIMYCELIAISEALSYALTLDTQRIVVITDSKSALLHLARLPSNYRGTPIALVIVQTIFELLRTNKTIILQWIPSHVGIMGNEKADQAAKLALSEGIPYTCLPLHSDQVHKVKYICKDLWQEYFDERSLTKGIWYRTIQAEPFRCPWFQDMEAHRQYVVTLLRLRSGHIPSNKFAHLMGKTDSPNCTDCNVIEDVHHVLLECVRNETQRRQALEGTQYNIGICSSILAFPFSESAKKLCSLYLSRLPGGGTAQQRLGDTSARSLR